MKDLILIAQLREPRYSDIQVLLCGHSFGPSREKEAQDQGWGGGVWPIEVVSWGDRAGVTHGSTTREVVASLPLQVCTQQQVRAGLGCLPLCAVLYNLGNKPVASLARSIVGNLRPREQKPRHRSPGL